MNVGPGRPLAADGVIQLAFDRYLLPASLTRQAFVLQDASGAPLPVDAAPLVRYDPVARTVTLSSPKLPSEEWLKEGLAYKLILPVAPEGTDQAGLRAIDRATIEPSQNRRIEFVVGPRAGVGAAEPTVNFCGDVLPIFFAKCSGGNCHGPSNRAAASLVLTTGTGVANTALSRVAQGANTGGISGRGSAPSGVFGVDMPLVSPGDPGSSWLLYKIELAPLPIVDAGPPTPIACSAASQSTPLPARAAAYVPLVPAQRSADEIERRILNDYVLGREMPYPPERVTVAEDQALTFEERERVRLWISQGALVPADGCGDCTVSTTGAADAGARDGG